MGDRAYVEIVCREEDEPLFEGLGFMEEFRHGLPTGSPKSRPPRGAACFGTMPSNEWICSLNEQERENQ